MTSLFSRLTNKIVNVIWTEIRSKKCIIVFQILIYENIKENVYCIRQL